jgi:mannitol-specific phosphotransferase system IIBC component
MKKKDYLLIIVVIFVSAILSFVISNVFISTPKNRAEKVEVVGQITPTFPSHDKQFFNETSINPTLIIQIGTTDNQNPLQKSAQ